MNSKGIQNSLSKIPKCSSCTFIFFQIPQPKTIGDPIINYFDIKPTYGRLDGSQPAAFGTITSIEIQMYLSEKELSNLDPSLFHEFLTNAITMQYPQLPSRPTHWLNNKIWTDFRCVQCRPPAKGENSKPHFGFILDCNKR